MDPTGTVASTWVTLCPEYKDRALWWKSLWIAHLTRMRTGNVIRAGQRFNSIGTVRAQEDCYSFSMEYARKLYIARGGRYESYIPRKARKLIGTVSGDSPVSRKPRPRYPQIVRQTKLTRRKKT